LNAYVDYATITVTYQFSDSDYVVVYDAFGINNVPANATIKQIKTEVGWKNSVSTAFSQLGIQLFKDSALTSSIAAETIDTSSPTTLTTFAQVLSNPSIQPSDLADGHFKARVRLSRLAGTPNPDFTGSIDFVRVTVQYDVEFHSLAECNPYNNWSATKLNPDPTPCQPMTYNAGTYPPFSVSRVFDAKCPSGTSPRWNKFGYTTSTPDGTRVEFRLRAFDYDASGVCVAKNTITADPPTSIAIASTTGDPQVCTADSGESGCPKDLYNFLGAPNNTETCLQMDAYGVPSANAAPTLYDWQVLYDCVPSL